MRQLVVISHRIDLMSGHIEIRCERPYACMHCAKMSEGVWIVTGLRDCVVQQSLRSSGPTGSGSQGAMPKARPLKVPLGLFDEIIRRDSQAFKGDSDCVRLGKCGGLPLRGFINNRIAVGAQIDFNEP
jgi:hypothetical protein